jgi:hypothetical protein
MIICISSVRNNGKNLAYIYPEQVSSPKLGDLWEGRDPQFGKLLAITSNRTIMNSDFVMNYAVACLFWMVIHSNSVLHVNT